MNTASNLLETAKKYPNNIAISCTETTIGYGELIFQVLRVAGALRACGVNPGDRVLLFLPNSLIFVCGYYATLGLGAVGVSIGASSTADEALHALKDSGAKVVLTTSAQAARLAGAATGGARVLRVDGEAGDDQLATLAAAAEPISGFCARDDSDPAAIVYSSGTTGEPKGVVLSHGNVGFTALSKVRYLGIAPDDRLLLFLPMHHCFGQNAIMHAAVTGGAALVLQHGFDPARVLAALIEDRVTMFFGVPTTFLALYDRLAPEHLATVRYWFSAAAPLPRALEDRWRERFGRPIYQGYGLSESSPFASYNHLEDPRPGTVGTAIEGVEMRIVDPESGAPLPDGVPGEIVIRGPNVMLGYWRRPADTAEAIRGNWLHSGDIGRRDADGFFTVEDRVKDMIVVGGENVYPAEVENAIYAHPGVAEAAVFGVPEPYLGEEVRVRVVMRPGFDPRADEIREVCRARLAPFKVPTTVEFAESLPKSPTGKVLKRILRAESAAAGGIEGSSAPVSVEAFVSAWLTERLGIAPGSLDPGRPFAELGVDSILAVALARDLGSFLDTELEPTLVWEFPSLTMLSKGMAARRAAGPARAAVAAEN